jgi:predicted RNase H-like nuclease (RuvC/YqgF family)
MKKHILVMTVIGCITGMLITGCETTPKQKVEGAKQNLKNAQAAYLTEWQAFKKEAVKKIEANQKRIEAFKEKMTKAGSKVKANYNKEVAVLEQKNQDLKKKLDEYKDDGQNNWEEFKTNFNNDMDAIGKTITDLFTDQE